MEKRKLDENLVSNELVKLVSKYSGVSNPNINADLEWNLGITGDDAVDFLVEYGQKFNVNISAFSFNEYFYDEGSNIMLIICKLFRIYRKKRKTIYMLLESINTGKLVC